MGEVIIRFVKNRFLLPFLCKVNAFEESGAHIDHILISLTL